MFQYYIGVNDQEIEGTFVYSDFASAIRFEAWADNNPSGDDSKNCVVMRADGKWHEEDCGKSYRFICEYTRKNLKTNKTLKILKSNFECRVLKMLYKSTCSTS